MHLVFELRKEGSLILYEIMRIILKGITEELLLWGHNSCEVTLVHYARRTFDLLLIIKRLFGRSR
jgi:hypothetical protein